MGDHAALRGKTTNSQSRVREYGSYLLITVCQRSLVYDGTAATGWSSRHSGAFKWIKHRLPQAALALTHPRVQRPLPGRSTRYNKLTMSCRRLVAAVSVSASILSCIQAQNTAPLSPKCVPGFSSDSEPWSICRTQPCVLLLKEEPVSFLGPFLLLPRNRPAQGVSN